MEYNYLTDYEEINTGGLHKEAVVAIWCQTYNHAEYIQYAFSGFHRQRTEFPFLVIIYDDASTDGTSDLVRRYAENSPDYVCAYIAKKNTYGNKLRKDIYQKIIDREFSGKYIALCEGDDCWVDRNKLQIQINFMEKHCEYAFTMHNSIRLNCITNGFTAFNHFDNDMDLTNLDIIIRDTRLATSSLVYRSEYEVMPDFFYNNGIGDYPRLLYLITKGKGFFFDRIMSVYRYGTVNSWTFKQENSLERQLIHLFNMANLLKKYNEYTDYHYRDEIDYAIHRRTYGVLHSLDIRYDCCRDMTDFIENFYKTHNSDVIYKEELLKLIRQREPLSCCSKTVEIAASRYKYVYIWGVGDGAERISLQMRHDGIVCDGYLISYESEKTVEFHGKNVYSLERFPFDRDDTLVIVSIYMGLLPIEGKNTLLECGFRNFLFPYVMKTGIGNSVNDGEIIRV